MVDKESANPTDSTYPCIKTLLSNVYSPFPRNSFFEETFEMLLKPSFLLAILFIMVSPSLAFDGSRGKESAEHLDNIRGFYNILRQSSKVTFAYFCGFQVMWYKACAN